MKLKSLRLNQVRLFGQPFELGELSPGLNLFVGPNESGKSTLVHALRAAFFERFKSSSVKDLQPWGDSSASPEISLTFEWQGKTWSLEKRFIKRQRCDLQTGNEPLSGEAAEDRLAELLGYSFSVRGASKAEHWGIPGLLWVEQGQTQDINAPVTYASGHLQSVLGQQLGEISSSQGDALLERIEAQSRKLLTATGQPNKFLKEAIQADEEAQRDVQALENRIVDYEHQVDELGRLTSLQAELDAEQPWRELRLNVAKAQQQLQQTEHWQLSLATNAQTLTEINHHIELLRDKLQNHDEQNLQLKTRSEIKVQAQAHLQLVLSRQAQLKSHRQVATEQEEQAHQLAKTARQASRRQRLQEEQRRVAQVIEQTRDHLIKAEGLQTNITDFTQQRAKLIIDKDALKRLRISEERLIRLGIEQNALAGLMTFTLNEGQEITVNGHSVSGQGEERLIQRTEIVIAGVGSLVFEPGTTNLVELQRQSEAASTERADCLKHLSVTSLPEAEHNAEADEQLGRDIEKHQQQLAFYAPAGLDALRLALQQNQQLHERITQQLADFPALPETVPTESDAEQALEAATFSLKQADTAWQTYLLEIAQAQQQAAAATEEWQQLADRLNAPNRAKIFQDAQNSLTDLQARKARSVAEMEALQKKIDSANPTLLKQDIERLTQSAENLEKEAQERTRQIDRLQSQLEQTGALGLSDSLEQARQQATALHNRRNELERHASALKLLLDELGSARTALTRKLQAPLQKHLNHYLNLLFPGANIAVDEQLCPSRLNRPNDTEANIAELSLGTREQMGLICRLAYADLLKAAGKPTLIILDDALVHSDTKRLNQIKRILFDASTRHQLLLFSCHPENWRDLGVPARDLQTKKTLAN